MKNFQSSTALLTALLMLLPAGAFAEKGPSVSEMTGIQQEQTTWHYRFTHPYTTRTVAPINLSNSTRLESLLRAGNLYLSLNDAVALALENNLDIELARYGPRIADADLLRATAGGVVRGVPTSVIQGPSSATNLQTGSGQGTAN